MAFIAADRQHVKALKANLPAVHFGLFFLCVNLTLVRINVIKLYETDVSEECSP